MNTNTTRRSFLKAAPVAALAVTLPAVAVAAPADRRAWEFAMACYQRVKAEEAAFDGPYLEAWQKCDSECSRVPHVTLPPEEYTGGQSLTTADAWEVRHARREIAALDAGKMRLDPLPGLREHYDFKRELVKAADERTAAIQAIRDRYDMDAMDERSDALGDQIADAASELMGTPAPDLAALRWKIDYTFGQSWEDDYLAQMLADMDHLLPEGR